MALLSYPLVALSLSLSFAVAACSGGGGGGEPDCSILKTDPGHAIVRLSMAELEHCVAPTGTDCERAAKLFAERPMMIPRWSHITTKPATTKAVCEGMPPALQKCLFPSYVVGHQPECAGAPAAAQAVVVPAK